MGGVLDDDAGEGRDRPFAYQGAGVRIENGRRPPLSTPADRSSLRRAPAPCPQGGAGVESIAAPDGACRRAGIAHRSRGAYDSDAIANVSPTIVSLSRLITDATGSPLSIVVGSRLTPWAFKSDLGPGD